MRTYAIGDIHGHLDKLKEAHRLIEADREATGDHASPVVHLGDLVDRGPNSAGVIDHLIDGISQGEKWVVLMGNHDHSFTESFRDEESAEFALSFGMGGMETMESYGVPATALWWKERRGRNWIRDVLREAKKKVPPEHLAFLEALPLTFERGECLFVHAGILPGVPVRKQKKEDLLWIRDEFLDSTEDHGPLVVHGHTIVDRPMHYGNRLALDTGAGAGSVLTAAVIEGRDAWVLEKGGRREMRRLITRP